MRSVSLRNSIDILEQVRMELQGKVEERVIQQLDEVIGCLIALRDGPKVDAESLITIMMLLADILAKVPSVATAIGVLAQGVCDAASH